MLPFRRFKRDAYMLDQCVTMVEDTVHEIGEYVNKDEDMTDSMTQTLSHLLDVYNDLLDVLDDDELTVNPRLHFRQYPRVRGYIRDSCNRCRSAVETRRTPRLGETPRLQRGAVRTVGTIRQGSKLRLMGGSARTRQPDSRKGITVDSPKPILYRSCLVIRPLLLC